MEALTGCRPENLGLRSIQLEPVGAHPPGYVSNAVLKLQRCRRTTESVDLAIDRVCVVPSTDEARY